MKKILLAMLLLFAGIMTGQAASYDIWVCGVQVTDSNKGNIGSAISSSQGTVTGSVSYNSSTKVLTVSNSSITTSKDHGIRIKISDVTVQFVGTCSITTTASDKRAIRYDKSDLIGTLQGSGLGTQVTMKGTRSGIYIDDNCELTVQNMTLSVTGTYWGICGHDGSHSEKLYVRGATSLTAEATASSGEGIGDMYYVYRYDNLDYILPQGGLFTMSSDRRCVVDIDNNIAKKVQIVKKENLGFQLAEINVTNCNWQVIGKRLKNDSYITDASSVTYNLSSNTLTLSGVSYNSSRAFLTNSIPGLKVVVKGNNNVDGKMSSTTDISFEGYLTSSYSSNVLTVNNGWFVCDAKLDFKYLNLSASRSTGTPIYGGTNAELTINKCKVKAEYTGSGSNYGAIRGFKSAKLTSDDVKSYNTFYRAGEGFVRQRNDITVTYPLANLVEIEVPTESYNIQVLGHQITNVNPDHFGVEGLIAYICSYDAASKTLTLSGSSIYSTEDNVRGISLFDSNSTILLQGSNTIKTAGIALLLGSTGTRIITNAEGTNTSGTTFESTKSAAVSGLTSSDYDLTVEADAGVHFIGSTYAFLGHSGGTSRLEFKKKGNYSYVELQGGSGITGNNPQVTMTDIDFSNASPGCYWDNGRVYQNGGILVTSPVHLAPVTTRYGVFVGGTEVTNANCQAIGSKYIQTNNPSAVFYNTSTSTLELRDVTINTGNANVDAIKNEKATDLKINVIGNCTLHSESQSYNALYLRAYAQIYGDGTLNLTGRGGNLSVGLSGAMLNDVNLNANAIFGQYEPGTRSRLDVKLPTKGKAVTASNGVYGLVSVVLNNCKILQPDGGHYDTNKMAMVDYWGNPAQRVVFSDVDTWTAIGDIETDADTDNDNADIYDLSGRKLHKPQKGVNIIRSTTGSGKKVILPAR